MNMDYECPHKRHTQAEISRTHHKNGNKESLFGVNFLFNTEKQFRNRLKHVFQPQNTFYTVPIKRPPNLAKVKHKNVLISSGQDFD